MRGLIAVTLVITAAIAVAVTLAMSGLVGTDAAHAQIAAEPRVAFVVGVTNYENAPSLANPERDAHLIADALTEIGFDVQLLLDPDQRAMEDGVIEFKRRVQAAGPETISLFYYAGHAIQANGINYLIPADALLDNVDQLATRAIEANWVLGLMDQAGAAANVIILDACRNDPFTRSWTSSSRAIGDVGLTPLNPPRGSMLMFSTSPGDVALDGEGLNSPFAEVLAEKIRIPGIRAETMFVEIVAGVEDATGGVQSPWMNFSFRGEFYFGGQSPDDGGAGDLLTPTEFEAMYWDLIAESTDPDDFEDYLTNFPEGAFAAQANARIVELTPPPPDVELATDDDPEGSGDASPAEDLGDTEPASDGDAATSGATPDPDVAATFRVVEARLTAEPAEYSGRCPATVTFRGRISAVGGSGTVSYRFVRSDGVIGAIETLAFDEPGSLEVSTSWTLGESGDKYEGWTTLEIFDPEEITTERTPFAVDCARRRDPSDTAGGSRYIIPDRVTGLINRTASADLRPNPRPDPRTIITRRAPTFERAVLNNRLIARVAAPRLRAPADNEVFNIYPRAMNFSWNTVPGAISYVLEVDAYGMCQAGAWCADIGGRTFKRPNLTRPVYRHDFVGAQPGRWRVWAVYEGGREGPKSAWRSFRHMR